MTLREQVIQSWRSIKFIFPATQIASSLVTLIHKFYDELDASQKHLRDGLNVAWDAALDRYLCRALARSTSRRSAGVLYVCGFFRPLESVKIKKLSLD